MLVRSGRVLGLLGLLIPLAVAATWQIATSIQTSTIERLKVEIDSQRRQAEATQSELKTQLNAAEQRKAPAACPKPEVLAGTCETELAQLRIEHNALLQRNAASPVATGEPPLPTAVIASPPGQKPRPDEC
jgi:hypothetical protein